jgi:hypothetical protein
MVLFFTVWLNFCGILFAHPMYWSVTNIDVDAQRGNVLLSIRIFTDDLETILHNKYNVDGWIGTPKEHRDGRRLLVEYMNERFSVSVNNGEILGLVTDSLAIIEDRMWFYMKGTARKTIRQVEIDNRLLTDFFSNQKNLMIISTERNEREKGYYLNRKNHKVELSL